MNKKKSLDNSEFRKNLCNYIEQYEKESNVNLKIAKENTIDDKKNSLLEKYTDITARVIEEDNEEDSEINEFTKVRKLSSNLKYNRRDDDDNIV